MKSHLVGETFYSVCGDCYCQRRIENYRNALATALPLLTVNYNPRYCGWWASIQRIVVIIRGRNYSLCGPFWYQEAVVVGSSIELGFILTRLIGSVVEVVKKRRVRFVRLPN